MPPHSNPTTLGQVFTLLARTHAHDHEATRLKAELDDAKSSCYAYSLELNQALQAVAASEAVDAPDTASKAEARVIGDSG